MNDKGVEPAIAIVIIIAVAIAIAIGVAYWVFGIIPAFTRYEELKIINAYIDTANNKAYIELKNTGTADTTVTVVLVNGRSGATIKYLGATWENFPPNGLTLTPGSTAKLQIEPPPAIGSYKAGVIYEFVVKTAIGGSYPINARAP